MSNVVPKLRFPTSEGEWETRPISENLTKVIDYRGKAPPKADTGVPLITARNVRDGYLDFSADEYIDEGLYDSWMRRGIPKKNDVLFTTEAPLANIALFPSTGCYALGQRIITLQTISTKCDTVFLFHLLRSQTAQRAIDARSTGTTAKGIKSKVFVRIPLQFPSSPEEQKKIADFLTSVDERIGQLIKKKALLEDYKKGVMQQLFSQQIRFKDDNGNDFPDWEEKKLGELGDFKSGVGFSESEQGGKVGTPFYKVSDMNLAGNESSMNSANHYVSDAQISANKYKVIADVSLVFAKVGAAIFLERKRVASNFLIDNNMMAFIPSFDISFAQHLFTTIRLSRFAQVGALPSYNASDLRMIKVSIPHPAEQKKIADFLTSVDQKIESVSQQIAKTQTFKKGLLQQMFV